MFVLLNICLKKSKVTLFIGEYQDGEIIQEEGGGVLKH